MASSSRSPRRCRELVRDGDTVALEGFTHLIPHAAGHELIRQGRRDLTLVRMTPDVVYDQLIGMGCARKLVFSLGRQPGRRLAAPAARRGRARLAARRSSSRSTRTPGWRPRTRPARRTCRSASLRGYVGSDLAGAHARRDESRARSPARSSPRCRRTGPTSASSTRSRPTGAGNVQLWGIVGVQKETVLASARSIVTVEEIVDELEPRPGAVVLPALGRSTRSRRAGRRASVVRARLLRARQRVLRRAGTRSAATATRSPSWIERARARSRVVTRDVAADGTADEMMAVEAARRLRDGTVCFVGIGLPSLAANLARRTHAPGCVLVYESGTIGAKPHAAAAVDRRRRAGRDGGHGRLGAGDVRLLAAGRPDRRRLPRRGADRPPRQPQQHGDRRLRRRRRCACPAAAARPRSRPASATSS